MTCSTLTRFATTKPETTNVRPVSDQTRKKADDRAFEDGIRRFLAVSRKAVAA
jgi:hypothetical protein